MEINLTCFLFLERQRFHIAIVISSNVTLAIRLPEQQKQMFVLLIETDSKDTYQSQFFFLPVNNTGYVTLRNCLPWHSGSFYLKSNIVFIFYAFKLHRPLHLHLSLVKLEGLLSLRNGQGDVTRAKHLDVLLLFMDTDTLHSDDTQKCIICTGY